MHAEKLFRQSEPPLSHVSNPDSIQSSDNYPSIFGAECGIRRPLTIIVRDADDFVTSQDL
jgi:hypothetical protein